MSDDATDADLLHAWKNGDEQAAALLYQRYQTRLMALIRSRLSRKLSRRIDSEDILLSAYRSFFVATRRDRSRLTPDQDLWPLLTTIALRKLAHQARRHTAERRSVDHEEQAFSAWLESAIRQEPTAEHVALLEDEIKLLMTRLDETARETLVRTLQGQDVTAIAEDLGINERSVRRALERVRHSLPNSEIAFPLSQFIRAHREKIAAKLPSPQMMETSSFDCFLLQQFVGAGAFSKVFRALERETGNTVAVKFLRKDCWHDTRATAALIREYEVLRQLNHPHILSIRGWGTTRRGALFLVMEFIEGLNLDEWCRVTNPDVFQLIHIVCQVADAVGEAHSRGILHGDLKPANVMMRTEGQVVLCDFGLARYTTAPDDVPHGGTAGFLAPEQISGAFGPVSERSDVYGLGGLLYYLLTGRPPMTGRDLPEILANVLSNAPPDSPSLHSRQSFSELDEIILRCLAKEPVDRYATAAEVSLAFANLATDG